MFYLLVVIRMSPAWSCPRFIGVQAPGFCKSPQRPSLLSQTLDVRRREKKNTIKKLKWLNWFTGCSAPQPQRCDSSVSLEWNFVWAESLLTQKAWAWKCIRSVASGRTRRSQPDDYSGGLCGRSNRLARGALYQISFCAEALHSFLTFTVGPAEPLCEASWLPVCAEAPAATLEKPDASDSHWLAPLVCSVWPVPLEEESGPITSRRFWDQHDVIPLLCHNRLQMRGGGASGQP